MNIPEILAILVKAGIMSDWIEGLKMKNIPPFRLVAEPLENEAAALPGFKAAGGDVGKRHKLGGRPDAIQSKKWPNCPDCREKMTFYSQIDSINDEFNLGDCGMIYTFVCFDCLEVKSILQSY